MRAGGTKKWVDVGVDQVKKGEGLCSFCSECEDLSPAGRSYSVICNSDPFYCWKLLRMTHVNAY